MSPYRSFLTSNGFTYQHSISLQNAYSKFTETEYADYYYNSHLRIHAFIKTLSYSGAIVPAYMTFLTQFKSGKIAQSFDCLDYAVVTDKNTYLFDHYHGHYEEVLASHIIDRQIEKEKIKENPFDQQELVLSEQDGYKVFYKKLIAENIIRETGYGYHHKFTLNYLKYNYKLLKGAKKARKVLKSKGQFETDEYLNQLKTIQQENEKRTLFKVKKLDSKNQMYSIKTIIIVSTLFSIALNNIPMLFALLLPIFIHDALLWYFGNYKRYQFFFFFLIPEINPKSIDKQPLEKYIVSFSPSAISIIIAVILHYTFIDLSSNINDKFLRIFIFSSLIINTLQLLPILPLSGSNIVKILFSPYQYTTILRIFNFFLIVGISAITYLSKLYFLSIIVIGIIIVSGYNILLNRLLKYIKKNKNMSTNKEKILQGLQEEKKLSKLSYKMKKYLAIKSLALLEKKQSSHLLKVIGTLLYLTILTLALYELSIIIE